LNIRGSRVVGVLSTRTTAEGPLYQRVLERYASDVQVITQVAPDLYGLREEQSQHSPEAARSSRTISGHWSSGRRRNCAGVYALSAAVAGYTGSRRAGVRLVDPSPAIARQTAAVWPSYLLTPNMLQER